MQKVHNTYAVSAPLITESGISSVVIFYTLTIDGNERYACYCCHFSQTAYIQSGRETMAERTIMHGRKLSADETVNVFSIPKDKYRD